MKKFDPFIVVLSVGILLVISGIFVVAKTATMPLLMGLVATIVGGFAIYYAVTKLYRQ